jgi:hypothetical protein
MGVRGRNSNVAMAGGPMMAAVARRLCAPNSVALGMLLAAVATGALAQSMSLPGKFGVDASGAATYSVPISAPPGTAGMVPALSLEYSSQGGNGVMGVGWSLAGIPAVGRCSRTLAQDGIKGTVSYDSNDRFCLDGQRLVAISGTYGADGAEYRTEIDNYSRIISHGTAGVGPAWFEVRTKSGQVLEFGHTTDSQILATGKTSVRSWSVNKVSDTKGNYYTVTYATDALWGQAYPSRIDYTGNSSASLSPYNSVRFVYGSRPESTPIYQGGSVVRTTSILTNVQTYSGSNLVADYRLAYAQSSFTQNSRLSSITLCGGDNSCLPATSFSWLTSSVNLSSAGPTGGSGFGDTIALHDQRYFIMDVNGDGQQDIIARSSGGVLNVFLSSGTTLTASGTTAIGWDDTVPIADTRFSDTSDAVSYANGKGYDPSVSQANQSAAIRDQRYFVMDVNGDGKDDFVARNTNGTFTVYTSNGTTFSVAGTFTTAFPDETSQVDQRFFVMDINGDGKKDMVMRQSDGQFYIYTSNGMTLQYSGNSFQTAYTDQTPIHDQRFFVTDVNGDGKDDLVIRGPDGTFFSYISNGSTLVYSGSFVANFTDANTPVHDQRYFIMDVNGDGRGDFVMRQTDGTLYVYLATGNSYTYSGSITTQFSDATAVADLRYFVMDVNGDGKDDLVLRGSNGYAYVYLSNGVNLSYAGSSSIYPFDDTYAVHDQRYFIMDVNGDGRMDLVARRPDGYYYAFLSNGSTFTYYNSWASTWTDSIAVHDQRYFVLDGRTLMMRDQNGYFTVFSSVGPSDVLSTVTTGLGATTTVSYKPLTDGTVYTKESSAVYPTIDVQASIYVVSRVDESNGIGGNYSTTYTYTGAKADAKGRGLLGFHIVKATDLQTNVVQTSTYRQDFPYIGMLASATKAISATTLNQTSSTLQFLNSSSGTTLSAPTITSAPYRVSVAQTVATGNDLDATALPTVTSSFQYDAYGNATQVTVATSDGYSKTTTNAFTNDTTNWFLGRLTSATVTSTTP